MKLTFLIKPNKSFLFPTSFNSKFFLISLSLIIFACSSTKRFSIEKNSDFDYSKSIRVLLTEASDELTIKVDSELYLTDKSEMIAEIKSGNTLKFVTQSKSLLLKISDKEFKSDYFFLNPTAEGNSVEINGKKYRGTIKIFINNYQIKSVNQISLEDYVKGVMTKEMPLGNGNENYAALKAFSICARTYAYNKIKEDKDFFDIYPDTRDQVYGGVDGETDITNKIVDETKGQLLFYDHEPAVMFYHSTCGGYTEDAKNVFTQEDIPYLKSIKDGNEPYCKISPRYEWIENYNEEIFIDRLFTAKLIENKDYELSNAKVRSRFESGRVNEFEITLRKSNGEELSVMLIGNRMRSLIKSSDGKSILRSNDFDIKVDQNKNMIISGKGSGHGVGLCQWGAIGQSKLGFDYQEILNHYFPGTIIKSIYD